jgi:hypothetical protein
VVGRRDCGSTSAPGPIPVAGQRFADLIRVREVVVAVRQVVVRQGSMAGLRCQSAVRIQLTA